MSSSPTPGQTAPADQATMVPSKDTHGFVANTIENGDYQEYAVRAARYVKDYPYRSASQKSAWTAVQYVKDHPYWSASMAMGLVPVVAPAAVGGLALGSVGLGAGGPVAGIFQILKCFCLHAEPIQGVSSHPHKQQDWCLLVAVSLLCKVQRWVVMEPPLSLEQSRALLQ